MTDFLHHNPFFLKPELHAIVARANSKLSGQTVLKRFGAAHRRPFLKPREHFHDAVMHFSAKPVQFLLRVRR